MQDIFPLSQGFYKSHPITASALSPESHVLNQAQVQKRHLNFSVLNTAPAVQFLSIQRSVH